MQTPRDIHLDCTKRVRMYVSGMIDYDILYNSTTPIPFEGYTNVDWASDKADKRLTSGFVFSLIAEAFHGATKSSR